MTDENAAVTARHDFLPFGEELTTSNRTAALGYGAFDNVMHKFTGQERDSEGPGLDFFHARYFHGAQGRFASPDVMLNSGNPNDPQTWHRYAYALNNPLALVDPMGLYNLVNTCQSGDKKCNKRFRKNADHLKNGLSDLQQAVNKMKDGREKARLQAALQKFGTEDDHNNVNVSFGRTGDKSAAQTVPTYGEGLGFSVTFDPKRIAGGTDSWAIDAAHEGTHIADISDPRFNDPSTTLLPFSLEYRGYETSAWAASALGEDSLFYGRGAYQIWNRSWGAVDDKTLTRFLTDMKDSQGRQTHPETVPHDPWSN
ncbi:MAG: RHS repeat-associated core domain-containing protein [Bryobacteraceae bacterium]